MKVTAAAESIYINVGSVWIHLHMELGLQMKLLRGSDGWFTV